MSQAGIAAALDGDVSALLDAMAYRGAPTGRIAVPGFAGGAVGAGVVAQDADGRVLIGDLHLRNGDAAAILDGWARFGVSIVERLEGWFAFVLYDPRSKSVIAARDAFGTRPLFLAEHGGRTWLASDIAALLRHVPRDEDADAVADHLAGAYRGEARTFFRAVRRVPAGGLWVRGEGSRRWFHAPMVRPVADAVGGFRARLQTSVTAAVTARSVVQLSGGLDSSAIAALAPGCTCVTATFAGLDCDESEYAAAAAAGHPWVRYDASVPVPLDRYPAEIAHPWRDMLASAWDGTARIARDRGADTVVSGFGGDQLLHEAGIVRDLARAGRWGGVFAEVLGRSYTAATRRELALDAFAVRLPALRSLRRRMLGRPDPEDPPDFTAAATWAWLTSPAMAWSVELQELQAARSGLMLRFPFLDAELARFVLGLPWPERVPRGAMKRLLRDAVPELPVLVRDRRRITSFDDAFERAYRASFPAHGGDPDAHERAWNAATLSRWRSELGLAHEQW
jgi:asparagine synthase (glutamine-hydrolysing)